MLIKVDTNAREPLAEQIAGQIRGAMASGKLAIGDRLPPARELAKGLDVNMHTVLRAYAELRDEGLIKLRRGRGATVRAAADPAQVRVHDLARDLVAQARRIGMSRDDVIALVRTVK